MAYVNFNPETTGFGNPIWPMIPQSATTFLGVDVWGGWLNTDSKELGSSFVNLDLTARTWQKDPYILNLFYTEIDVSGLITSGSLIVQSLFCNCFTPVLRNTGDFVDLVDLSDRDCYLNYGFHGDSTYNSSLFLWVCVENGEELSEIPMEYIPEGAQLVVRTSNPVGFWSLTDAQYQEVANYIHGKPLPTMLYHRRRIIENSCHLETATGSLISFETNMTGKLYQCKIEFEGTQEGGGAPSPDNIRPITGWIDCNVTHTGENLLDVNSEMVANPVEGNMGLKLVLPAGTYTAVPTLMNASTGNTHAYQRMRIIHADGTYENYKSFSKAAGARYTPQTFTLADGDWVFLWAAANGTTARIRYSGIVVVKGETAPTENIPYLGTTYNITFPSTGGAGYIDLVKKQLVINWSIVTLDGVTNKVNGFTASGDSHGFGLNLGNVAAYHSSQVRVISSHFNGVGYNRRGDRGSDLTIFLTNSSGGLRIRYDALETGSTINDKIDTFNNWLVEQNTNGTPVQVMYQRKTPITQNLTLDTIKTLKGVNHIYSTANGPITVKYWTF